MALRSTLRAFPTLFRVGMAEAVAYRAEMLVWVLATTMPFVSLALWTAVSSVAPVVSQGGRSWAPKDFVAYFLCAFIVRQLISAWACWEINFEVRQGTLSMRLLRPLHPLIWYAVSNLSFAPLRVLVTLPVVAGLLLSEANASLSRDGRIWGVWLFSIAGGWMVNFFANVAIGSLCLYFESSIKLMDVWLASFFVFSGYLFPFDLFPPWLRVVAQWLPFRFQMGLSIELMTGAHTFEQALPLLGQQWMWAGALAVLAVVLWNRGVKRFQAFGG